MDVSDPEVSEPQQLLIEVQAAGVGNRDDVVRAGNWDVGSTPPMALGVEAAGTILAIGPGVTRFRVGDEGGGDCAASLRWRERAARSGYAISVTKLSKKLR